MKYLIQLEKAMESDADLLTSIQIKSFDDHAEKWGSWTSKGETKGPGGYDSINHVKYLIKVSNFHKIILDNEIIGGISVFITGNKYATIDTFFIHPNFKNRNIGMTTMELIEKKYNYITRWELGTSLKSQQNHAFYEKAGYRRTDQDENYVYYDKIIESEMKNNTEIFQNKELAGSLFIDNVLTMTEFNNCAMDKTVFSALNLHEASFTNSYIKDALFNNVNLTTTRFHNCNLDGSIFGDININNIEICEASIGGAYIHDTNLGFHQSHGPVTFERCDLTGSKITDCSLQGVEISSCNINGMKINGILVEELLKNYQEYNK